MKLIGREDLVDDPKYINCVKMNEAGLNAEVVSVMDDALAKMTCTEALALFKDAGIPIELCQTPLDVYEDQNVWDNESERNIPTVPIQFESQPVPDYTPTGMLGSATVEVMKDLGYTSEEIEAAIADGSVCGATSLDVLAG